MDGSHYILLHQAIKLPMEASGGSCTRIRALTTLKQLGLLKEFCRSNSDLSSLRLIPRRRKRRKLVVPREECSTTEDLLMLWQLLVASEDPTLMQHNEQTVIIVMM